MLSDYLKIMGNLTLLLLGLSLHFQAKKIVRSYAQMLEIALSYGTNLESIAETCYLSLFSNEGSFLVSIAEKEN